MVEKILIVEDELIIANHLAVILKDVGHTICGIARSVPRALEIIEIEKPQIVLLDIFLKGNLTGIDLANILNEKNIAFVYLSANSNQSVLEAAKLTQPYGFMIKPFREQEVIIAMDIACYRYRNSLEAELRKEVEFQDQLHKVQETKAPFHEKISIIVSALQDHIPFDFIEVGRINNNVGSQWCSFYRIGFSEYQAISLNKLSTIAGLSGTELEKALTSSAIEIKPSILNASDFQLALNGNSLKRVYSKAFKVNCSLTIPLFIDHGQPFVFSFYSKQDSIYDVKMMKFLGRVQQALTETIMQITAVPEHMPTVGFAKITLEKSEVPKLNGDKPFSGIIGNSQPILVALDYVKQVAGVDTSVLILGETGTGKEIIAQSIHNLSKRSSNALIKVNCAALPFHLIESELFGHEKGAFTGALTKRIGRFEQANGGTIFLDEIAEIPLEVQVKLLRVLQEREIERVGGQETVHLDVRIVAATNKNLEKEVAEGRFRVDLYYRLNVFPILLPPLRKRIEDIPLLVNHFINLYAEKYQKKINGIEPAAMAELMRYTWPGNVRELENTLERSIVLTGDGLINNVFLPGPLSTLAQVPAKNEVKTIEEVEKEHILIVLHRCNQKIYGPGGAAEILNIPPSTLTSKMKKLGITKA